jgi:hypothetical protein
LFPNMRHHGKSAMFFCAFHAAPRRNRPLIAGAGLCDSKPAALPEGAFDNM